MESDWMLINAMQVAAYVSSAAPDAWILFPFMPCQGWWSNLGAAASRESAV